MRHIELTDAQIANIREKLRTSGDRHLLPLGNNLTDEQIEKLTYIVQETDNATGGSGTNQLKGVKP